MTNLVTITVKATSDASSWAATKAQAAKAGAEAADAFDKAFKLRASAKIKGSESAGGAGLAGEDKGLLNRIKSYANTPGGIGILGTGNDTSLMSMLKNQIRSMGQNGGPGLLGTGGGNTSSTELIRQVLENSVTGNVSTEDVVRQILTGQGPTNVTTQDVIEQVLAGNSPGNVTTKDLIDQILQGTGPSNVTTKDFIDQIVKGNTPGDIDTKDIIHPTVDDKDIAGLGQKDGKTYGAGFASGLKNAMSGVLGKVLGSGGGSVAKDVAGRLRDSDGRFLAGAAGGGGGGGGGGDLLNAGGVAGGALPGIMGLSGMQSTIIGLAGAVAALLPALVSVGSGLAVIGGGFALAMATSKKFAASVKSDLSGLEKIGGEVVKPLIGPLEQGLSSLMGYFKQIAPDLKEVFGAAGPLIQPLVKGFEQLMSGAGPGFFAMIKAAGPVFQSISGAFADLGKSLGTMFSDFASDGKGSAQMLSGLLGIINSLLPFIGQLGKIMVSALAPAFKAFAGALGAVLPALNPLMKIIGELAGAVLTDLGSVLEAVGAVLKGLAPSFTLLAKVASNMFNTLENTGVFAIIGDALENLAKPIADLVNALVKSLAPALPPIITLVSQMSNIVIALASAGLGVLITALADVIKWLSPILPLLLDAVVAWKALTIAVGIFNAVMDLDPFVAIGAAIVLLVGIVVKYHTQILGFIEKTWDTIVKYVEDAWNAFLSFAKQWWPLLLGPAGLILKYHTAAEAAIEKVWHDIVSGVESIWNAFLSFAKQWWPLLLGGDGLILKYHADIEAAIKRVWDDILNWLKGLWNNILSAASSAWNAIKSGVTTAWNAVKSLTTAAWQAVYNDIVSPIETAYSFVTSKLGDLRSGMSGVWSGIQGDAKAGWGALEKIMATPINFVINDVYMGGIRQLWDDVMGALGLGSLDLPAVSPIKLAAGGKLPGFGGGDRVPALLEPGEAVVDKHRTSKYAPLLKAMGVPGFASGGLVGGIGSAIGGLLGLGGTAGKMVAAAVSGNQVAFANALSGALPHGGGTGEWAKLAATVPVKLVTDIVKGAWHQITGAAASAGGGGGGTPGPGGGAPAANAALARKLYPKWATGANWSAWNNVAMAESGWNQFADNPSSGAYGIPQALPFTKMPKAAWPKSAGGSSNPTAQITWMAGYMSGRYGGPQGAWAHEQQYHWYGDGLDAMVTGRTLLGVGERGTEHVQITPAGKAQAVQLVIDPAGESAFEQFMVTALRRWVRTKGGGNVQSAFGGH